MMKLALPVLLLTLVCTVASSPAAANAAANANAADMKSIRGETKSADKLFQNARRVEQNNYGYGANNGYGGYYGGADGGGGGGGGGGQENWFLADYSLKMISCIQGEQSINYERGEVETSTVIFRLCPKDSCGSNSTMGCGGENGAGYGDFAVGINTFAEAYTESVRDNYNNGMQYYSYEYGEFNVEEYMKDCRMFEGGNGNSNGNGNGGNSYNNYGYSYAYLGPACTTDGTDIRLASFSDPYCTQESEASFESTHNGMALPYGNGGLVPDTCMSCLSMNDNYEYEVSEMCKNTYEDASYRCEQNMQSYNAYYGQDNSGCEYLESKLSGNYVANLGQEYYNAAASFFGDQSETTKMAEGYVALLVLAGMFGAATVFCFVKKTVKKVRQQRSRRKADVAAASSVKKTPMIVNNDNDNDNDVEEDYRDETARAMNVPSVIEFVRSTTKMMKSTVHITATKVAAMTRSASRIVRSTPKNKEGGIINNNGNSEMEDSYNTLEEENDVEEEDEIVAVNDYVAPSEDDHVLT